MFGVEEISRSHHPKCKDEQELPRIHHKHFKFEVVEVMVCDEAKEVSEEVFGASDGGRSSHLFPT